jgi:septum formation protein
VVLILASSSPRRAELLEQLGVRPKIEPAAVDEAIEPDEAPAEYVERLARDKAAAVMVGHSEPDAVVLAADTTVVVDGLILGKPAGALEAAQMLRLLSGRQHEVLTGVAVGCSGVLVSDVARTSVSFLSLSDEEISAYVETGEPFDKAGGYGLQGAASMFVTGIDGPVDNVIGLPRRLTGELFDRLGLDLRRAADDRT